MPQAAIKYVHGWANSSARKEHQDKMIFLNQNKERYDCDNSDLDDDAGNTENNPSPLNDLLDKLPGIDLESDHNDTSAVTPEIAQSDAERIQEARTNSVLIPDGNTGKSAGVATLVDDNPLGGGNPIDVPQECVSPKIEELDPPQIKVEDVSREEDDDGKT